MITRLNKSCAYFPCHNDLGDCTFCYCPFYPCVDKRRGRYVITKGKLKIWSCQDCAWIHDKKVVDKIFRAIRGLSLTGKIGEAKAGKTGVIILGHGSKVKKANDSLCRLTKKVKTESRLDIVEPAFLQLSSPDLRETIRKVLKMGCKRIVIVPYFLFIGNHVARDIPKIIAEESKAHKEVKFIYAKNIGQNPKIVDVVMDSIRGSA